MNQKFVCGRNPPKEHFIAKHTHSPCLHATKSQVMIIKSCYARKQVPVEKRREKEREKERRGKKRRREGERRKGGNVLCKTFWYFMHIFSYSFKLMYITSKPTQSLP